MGEEGSKRIRTVQIIEEYQSDKQGRLPKMYVSGWWVFILS